MIHRHACMIDRSNRFKFATPDQIIKNKKEELKEAVAKIRTANGYDVSLDDLIQEGKKYTKYYNIILIKFNMNAYIILLIYTIKLFNLYLTSYMHAAVISCSQTKRRQEELGAKHSRPRTKTVN